MTNTAEQEAEKRYPKSVKFPRTKRNAFIQGDVFGYNRAKEEIEASKNKEMDELIEIHHLQSQDLVERVKNYEAKIKELLLLIKDLEALNAQTKSDKIDAEISLGHKIKEFEETLRGKEIECTKWENITASQSLSNRNLVNRIKELEAQKQTRINLNNLKKVCSHFANLICVGHQPNPIQTFERLWENWLSNGNVTKIYEYEHSMKDVVRVEDLLQEPESHKSTIKTDNTQVILNLQEENERLKVEKDTFAKEYAHYIQVNDYDVTDYYMQQFKEYIKKK